MRILVLGTSNSLLKRGWVDGLQAALPTAQIVNRSIGGSPGTQYACEVGTDFSKFDLVFFDSIPNDEIFDEFLGTSQFFDRVIFELFSTIRAQTSLIVIGFCLAVNLEKASAVYRSRRLMAKRCAAPFIDMRELVIKFGPLTLGSQENLYETDAHPKQKIQRLIGYEIGAHLAKFLDSPTQSPAYIENFADHFWSISSDDPNRFPDTKQIRRSNSLFNINFLSLTGGDEIRFSEGRCIGFYLNMFNTRCFIELIGPNGSRYKEYLFRHEVEKFEVRFMPIANGHFCDQFRILANDLPFERTAYSTYSHWPSAERPATAEIWKLAFWAGNPEDPVPEACSFDESSMHRNIETSLGKKVL